MIKFVVHAEVTCEDCGGQGCTYCKYRGFNRERIRFIADKEGNVLKIERV